MPYYLQNQRPRVLVPQPPYISTGQPMFLPPQTYQSTQYDTLQPTFVPAPVYHQQQYEIPIPVQQTGQIETIGYSLPAFNPHELDDIPTEYRAMLSTNYPPRRDDDIPGWFEFFQREINIYKQAIRRVIQDVMQLRIEHKILAAANHELKGKIEIHDRRKKILYEILQGDKIDKGKIQDIFNNLSAKISAQSLELKENHAKIANYEKELARRGELRAQYDALVQTSLARDLEIKLLKERMYSAETLEDTVRHQEVVIEKLEAMIKNYMKQKQSKGAFNDMDKNFISEHAAIDAENKKLPKVSSFEHHSTAATQSHQNDLIQQNLTYQQELASLKARFQENIADWGKEKAELLARIDDLERASRTTQTQKSKPS